MVNGPGTPLLELDEVGFTYGQGIVIEQLNDVVHEGERLALLGRSGVGKSTVLRLLGGLLQPTSGRLIRYRDDEGSEASCSVGFVFQDHGLLPWLTARENIRLALRLKKGREIDRAGQDSLIDGTARELSIGSVLPLYPHQLSGGMRQRVALARALVTGPHLLCLDEPFSALDPVLRREARQVVETAIAASGAATVIVTHDVNDALKIADRIWLLKFVPDGPAQIMVFRRGEPGWSPEGLTAAYG